MPRQANATKRDADRGYRQYSQADFEFARLQQRKEIEAGSPYRTIPEIMAMKPAKSKKDVAGVVDLKPRQLRARGPLSREALRLDQLALMQTDTETAAGLRQASGIVKSLKDGPPQLKFDLWRGGNRWLGDQYFDYVLDGLETAGFSQARKDRNFFVLSRICRRVRFGTYECDNSAAELAAECRLAPPHMSKALKDLRLVGAITWVKRGRANIITVTPEGMYCGLYDNHDLVLLKYQKEVAAIKA